jgi:hypothetical protein
VTPVSPYYVNQFTYDAIRYDTARTNAKYPLFRAAATDWFAMRFRSHYLWESATLFPCDDVGRELLGAMNANKARFLQASARAAVRYDGGGWAGWKDDLDAGSALAVDTAAVAGGRALTPFETTTLPVAVGPRTAVAKDMLFHLVLVNERRASAAVL